MTLFLQACAGVLLAVFLILTLGSHGKNMGNLLAMAICCMVAGIALGYLRPVMDFLKQLENLGNLNGELIRILLKIAGIGMLTEITSMVCSDAGNSSMGKTLQLLGSVVILWLSVPIFNMLMDLLQEILGEV